MARVRASSIVTAPQTIRRGSRSRTSTPALAADGVTAPTGTNAYAWDPALIVVSVLRSLGTSATSAQIRAAIENLHDFPGAGGIYDFSSGDQHGATVRSILVVRNDPDHPGNTKIVSKQGGAPL